MPFTLFKKPPSAATPAESPIRRREDFLSPAEAEFFLLLQEIAAPLVVCPRVPLGALFYIVQPKRHPAMAEYVRNGRIDFLLCRPKKQMLPYLAVELLEPGREGRDELLEQVCAAGGLPLLWVEGRQPFDVEELKTLISGKLRGTPRPEPAAPEGVLRPASPPGCPVCGKPMLLRTAGHGAQAEMLRYTCPDAPKCPGELPYTP